MFKNSCRLSNIVPGGHTLLVSHKVDVQGSWQGQIASSTYSVTQHRTALKVPLADKKSQARAECKRHPADRRVAFSLELGPKGGKKNSNNSSNGNSNGSTANKDTMSDGEGSGDDEPSSSNGQTQKKVLKTPNIKLEVVPPQTPSQQQACTLTWRQTWTPALRSNVCYRSSSNQLTVDVRGRPIQGLQASGSIVAVAGAPVLTNPVNRFTGRLRYKTKHAPGGRRTIQAQTSVSGASGATHSVKVQQQRPADDMQGSVEVQVTPREKKAAVKFEVSIPF